MLHISQCVPPAFLNVQAEHAQLAATATAGWGAAAPSGRSARQTPQMGVSPFWNVHAAHAHVSCRLELGPV